jgi:hypothetical protein
MVRVARAVCAAVVLVFAGSAGAADAPPLAGNWKIIVAQDDSGRAFWLLKLENKDGKWSGDVSSFEGILPAKLQKLSVEKDTLHFTLALDRGSLACEVKVPATPGDKLLGAANTGRGFIPLRLERTTLTKADDSYEVNKELMQRPVGDPQIVDAAIALLKEAGDKKAKEEEVRAWADKAVKTAELHGPRWHRQTLLNVAEALADQEAFAKVAVTYARQAERLLDPKDPGRVEKQVLDTLAKALEKAGKADEAKEVKERIKKIDLSLKPQPFAGRKGKSDRAVLVELFTGAECPPCVAADMAFDALGKSFKPSEVILLQYHLHIPGPDPLTNPDTEARSRFYKGKLRGTPAVFMDGVAGPAGGGKADDAEDKYQEYTGAVEQLLEKAAGAKIKLTATRKGEKIDVNAEVSDASQTGPEVRLRVVLVEEAVSYTGANKLPVHHHVVRAFADSPDGTILKNKDLKKAMTIDLDEVRKTNKEYLDKYAEKLKADMLEFPNKERPMELKNLKVVAFVQNDDDGEVLQAVQVDVK